MAGETSVGGISGFLKMDADQFHRELEKAIAEIDALKGKEAKVRIEVDADQVHRELPIVREEIDQVSRSNDTLGSSSRNAGGGVGALATAVLTLGPALIPLTAGATGAAAGLLGVATGAAVALRGITQAMAAGTDVGRAYTAGVETLKGNLDGLAKTAASNVLAPFQAAVESLQGQMPALTDALGGLSTIAGKVAGNLATGLVSVFVQLQPLIAEAAVYILQLSSSFASLMSGPGVVTFGDYIRSVFPQVMQSINNIVETALRLVVALEPLGAGVLTAITAVSTAINAIPLPVLTALVTGAGAVFIGFQVWRGLTAIIAGVEAGLVRVGVAAETTATSIRIMSFAAGGIGIAIAALSVIFIGQAEAARQNQAAVDDYADALRRTNGVIDQSVVASTAKSLADAGVLDTAHQLGVNLGDVTQAALGNAGAMARVNTQLDGSRSLLAQNAAGSLNAADAIDLHDQKVKDLTGAISGNNTNLNDAIQKNKDLAAATAVTTGATQNVSAGQDLLSTSLGTTTTALLVARDAQQANATQAAQATVNMQMEENAAGLLKGSLDALNGTALSAAQTQQAFDSTLSNMGDHITATGKKITFTTTSINDMSTASVALRGQLLGQVTAAESTAGAYGQMTGSSEKGRAKLVELKDQIIKNAVAHGVDKAAVQGYIDKVLQIPKTVPPTHIEVDAAAAISRLSQVQGLLASLHDKTINVITQTQTKNILAHGPGGAAIAANAAGSILMPDGSRPVTAMAAGGMISDRPILWAEDGPEAYIPLSPSRRGPRTTGILAAANEALGNPLDAGKGGTNITVNTSQGDPYALAAEIARYQAFESVL